MPINVHQEKLLKDFEKILENKYHSDVTLVVNGKEFQAHAAILAARFPELTCTNLRCEKKKKKSCQKQIHKGVNELQDFVDQSLMEEFLRYVYTGRVGEIGENGGTAIKMFALADKYNMDQFKKVYEDKICKSLSNDNCVKFLIEANNVGKGCDRLRNEAINYINQHKDEIFNTMEFEDMVRNYPDLSDKIHKSFILAEE